MWHLLKGDPNRLLDGSLWINPDDNGFISLRDLGEFEAEGLWLLEKGRLKLKGSEMVSEAFHIEAEGTLKSAAQLDRLIKKAKSDFDSLTAKEKQTFFLGILALYESHGDVGTPKKSHLIVGPGYAGPMHVIYDIAHSYKAEWIIGDPLEVTRGFLNEYGVPLGPFDWHPTDRS